MTKPTNQSKPYLEIVARAAPHRHAEYATRLERLLVEGLARPTYAFTATQHNGGDGALNQHAGR